MTVRALPEPESTAAAAGSSFDDSDLSLSQRRALALAAVTEAFDQFDQAAAVAAGEPVRMAQGWGAPRSASPGGKGKVATNRTNRTARGKSPAQKSSSPAPKSKASKASAAAASGGTPANAAAARNGSPAKSGTGTKKKKGTGTKKKKKKPPAAASAVVEDDDDDDDDDDEYFDRDQWFEVQTQRAQSQAAMTMNLMSMYDNSNSHGGGHSNSHGVGRMSDATPDDPQPQEPVDDEGPPAPGSSSLEPPPPSQPPPQPLPPEPRAQEPPLPAAPPPAPGEPPALAVPPTEHQMASVLDDEPFGAAEEPPGDSGVVTLALEPALAEELGEVPAPPPEESAAVAQARRIFAAVDKDASGFVDRGELRAHVVGHLVSQGVFPTDEVAEAYTGQLFANLDADRDGRITAAEWVRCFAASELQRQQGKGEQAFVPPGGAES